MTSSHKRTARPRPSRLRYAIVALLCLGAFGVAILAFRNVAGARSDPAAARTALAQAEAAFNAGNMTAARTHANTAARADPQWGKAHIVFARTLLALSDGVGAEAELRRAIDAGVDPRETPHLIAHALVLQGDAPGALAQLAKALPAHRGYAARVRAQALTLQNKFGEAEAALAQAQQLAPGDADTWIDQARFDLRTGNAGGAIAATDRAVRADPNNVAALALRAQMVRDQYGLVASLPWFEAALRRDPDRHDVLIDYAATLGDAGRARDMLAATRRALALSPNSPQALYLLAVLAARAENFDLARGLMERTGDALSNVPGALLLAGTLDLEAGEYQQAIARLRQLVGMQPMNIAARRLLATALLRTDAARNAIDLLRPVVTRGDADSYAYALAARGFERIDDRDMAGQLLDRASMPIGAAAEAFSTDESLPVLGAQSNEAPGDPRAAIPLIRGLLAAGNPAGALARAEQMARDNPGSPASLALVGDVLSLTGRPADALVWYRRAADIRFDQPAMLRLVEAMERAGQRGQAANTLALFLSQNPNNAVAQRLAAHWQIASGEYDEAIATLEDLKFRLGDRDAGLLAELSAAYAGAGRFDAAVDNGALAYALAPMNVAAIDAYGWALRGAGDSAAAVALLRKAVSIAPGMASARWHLARAYADAGKKAEAKAQVQAALAAPGFAQRADAQQLLASLG